MALTANRTLQYSTFVACSCGGVAITHTPGFTIKALALALGPTGAKPIYLSLAGAATTSDCWVSTGQSLWWPSLPSGSDVVSFIATASGPEVSLTVFG
jgi:hypothetical protein